MYSSRHSGHIVKLTTTLTNSIPLCVRTSVSRMPARDRLSCGASAASASGNGANTCLGAASGYGVPRGACYGILSHCQPPASLCWHYRWCRWRSCSPRSWSSPWRRGGWAGASIDDLCQECCAVPRRSAAASPARAFHLLSEDEYEQIIRAANRRDDIDCWLVPNPAWSTAARLRGPKICFFPDFVFAEHWTGFPIRQVTQARDRIAALASSSPHYICFSKHVREAHAKLYFGIPDTHVRLIRHAPVKYGAPPQDEPSRRALRCFLARRFAIGNAIDDIEQQHVYPYLNSLDLPDIPYLFVSTQMRPYQHAAAGGSGRADKFETTTSTSS